MLEQFILGMVQGIAEWLPVSSEGMIVLVKANFLHSDGSLGLIIKEALFLHLGTFFAALIYFRKDVAGLVKALFSYQTADIKTKKTLQFLIVSTIISGILGYVFLQLMEHVEVNPLTGKMITGVVALLLFITAGLQFLHKNRDTQRGRENLTPADSTALGLVQGFAALPGLSRSGLTVSALLLSNIDKTEALRLSFLMSLPIVLAGNIILNLDELFLNMNSMVGLASSFVFGLLTIDALLRFARKVHFGYFILFFAFITLLSAFI